MDGADGAQGPAGPAGPRGPQGPAGPMGPQGPAGEVPTEFVNTTNNTFSTHNRWFDEFRDYHAAESALQVHLPQDRNQRLTFNATHLNSTTGFGVGYAYAFDNDRRTALTAAIGFAGDEAVVKVGVGFELGQKRMPVQFSAPAPAVSAGSLVVPEAEYLALVASVKALEQAAEDPPPGK